MIFKMLRLWKRPQQINEEPWLDGCWLLSTKQQLTLILAQSDQHFRENERYVSVGLNVWTLSLHYKAPVQKRQIVFLLLWRLWCCCCSSSFLKILCVSFCSSVVIDIDIESRALGEHALESKLRSDSDQLSMPTTQDSFWSDTLRKCATGSETTRGLREII